MRVDSERLRGIWWRTATLGWPIGVQQFLNTLMRTVDIVVTGLFSPAAIAAVGLADLYTDIPRRIGSSLGAGAIALSSQDTGRGAVTSRDAAITQALLIGALVGLPFVVVGVLIGHLAIAVLGASAEVARLGGVYLTIIFAVAPMRIVGYVGASALQGTGDTRTPMFVSGGSNLLNVVATVALGLGVGPIPRLGIVGVGLATALSRVLEAIALLGVIASDRTGPSLARPRSLTATRQLLAISTPRFGEQMSMAVVSFPFNALLLTFGTEVNAAYHIGRRVHHQLGGPLYRSYSTVASILVGQALGEGDPDAARFSGFAIVGLGLGTVGVVAAGLIAGAEPLAGAISDDPTTIRYAAAFTRVFAVAMLFKVVFFVFSGGLRSAGDAKTPFYAQFVGQFALMLGFSYLVSVVAGFGLVGVYLGIVLTYALGAVVTAHGFARGMWADTARALIEERSTVFD